MSDLLDPLSGDPSQFIVVANERDAGIVCFVFFLQIDEGSHAAVEQQMDSFAMVRRIRATRVGTRQKRVVEHPVCSVARGRLEWNDKRGWDAQSKTLMERGRMTP